MISREYAEKLRKFVKWEPEEGDWWTFNGMNSVVMSDRIFHTIYNTEDKTWYPRLDQLLTMIEAEGYKVNSCGYNSDLSKYSCELYTQDHAGYWYEIYESMADSFTADTREDACAKALLWIKGERE